MPAEAAPMADVEYVHVCEDDIRTCPDPGGHRTRSMTMPDRALLTRACLACLLPGIALAQPPHEAARVDGRLMVEARRLAERPHPAGARITLIVEADALDAAELAAQDGALRFRRGRLHEITLPAGRIAALLARLPAGSVARLPYPHQALAVTSQGVAITGAADMQALGYDGTGIKVGVIDLGFASLAAAQASGDLPADLVQTDYTGTGIGGSTHGTNVAQIVHDMAPGATLHLAKISTEVQLAQAVADMAAAGVRVINHSVAWFGAAFYDGGGPICAIAGDAEAQGIQWVNAAGNYRLKHYLGAFTDGDADLRHEFAAGKNHNTLPLSANSAVTLVLNWDAYPETRVDYDLYLYDGDPDSGGVLLASSTNRQSGRPAVYYPYPYEIIDYTPSAGGTGYIVVKKADAAQPSLPLTLFSTNQDLATRTTASSLAQPADCGPVLAAGAVNLSDLAEAYSSEGPTTDGRAKPELAAPVGVRTSLTSAFAGTSAAAPHAAGAAALLLDANPGLTPAGLRGLLSAAVKDVGSAGYDYRTGHGRVSLDADGDGLNHDLELALGTSPLLADTDGDGLSDWAEVYTHGTSPTLSDKADLAPRGAPDGQVTLADLLVLVRLAEGLAAPTALEAILADMNGDGLLDVRDILQLRRQLGY
jgi:subtilisin family serine protease